MVKTTEVVEFPNFMRVGCKTTKIVPLSSTTTTSLLILIGLLSTTSTIIEALTLPNLIGAISHQQRHNHLQSSQRRQQQQHRRGSNGAPSNNNGGNQMHPNSITLTIDDEDPSGLWNVMSSNSGAAKKQRQQEQQRRLIRFGFHFFRVGRGGGGRGVSNDNSVGAVNQRRAAATALQQSAPRPYGPVPRGGTLEDLVVLPSSSFAASSSTTAATMAMMQPPPSSSSSANSIKNKQRGLWSNVRNTMRGIRRTVIHSTVSTFINDSHNNNNNSASHHGDMRMNDNEMIMMHNLFDRHGDGAAVNNMSVLRVGGMINRHLKSRRLSKVQAQGYAVESERAAHVNKAAVVTAAARGGDASMTSTLSSSSSSSSSAVSSSTSSTATEETTFIIETPLFPIILPKAWEAPFKGTSSYSSTSSSSTSTTTTSSSSTSYIESLEITIAPPEDPTSTTTTGAKPTPHQLQSATLPLIPKSTWESFTGNEFFHPEAYDGLVSTGVLMGTTAMSAEYVNWSGDKKTDKFIKEHDSGSSSDNDGDGDAKSSSSWYEALDSSQEVLVWSGKFIGDKGELYGAELPIIKTTSIIHKSPKYLAELLMDSTKVKAYNKMSLGRDDVEVFQSGVDTTEEEGKFGNVGESKIVRNLTRPPMVNSNLEFVTCMHARKLSQQDLQTLSSNNNDPNQPTDGYIVVSRAVTGGQWNSDDSNNVRNEIILGVNILRQVPNEPDKTELIAVTHVYSPMIPLMLAKNAGVKGAVDFVRDIRSLP